MNPLISIIMPAYNYASFIHQAIDSILSQSYSHFELIIVNDASTDDTEDSIFSYKDDRIKYYKNEYNMGSYPTWNRGMRLAKGKYVCCMDADDYLPINSLELRLNVLNDASLDLVHTGLVRVDRNKHEEYIKPLDTNDKNNIIEFLKSEKPNVGINGNTFLFKRESLNKVGYRIPEKYGSHADYELNLRLLFNCNSASLDKNTYYYNYDHSDNSSKKAAISIEEQKKLKNLQLEYLLKMTNF